MIRSNLKISKNDFDVTEAHYNIRNCGMMKPNIKSHSTNLNVEGFITK